MKKIFTRAIVTVLCLAMLATCALTASAADEFSDVKSNNWFYGYVTYMSGKGIIHGYPEGTFLPSKDVNRSEFIKMMVATFGLTAKTAISFNDVSESNWYHEYYSKAAAQGFLGEVFTGNTMRPTDPLRREEAAALLMAYLDYPEDAKASSSKFEDYTDIASEYRDYVLQAAEAGIIDGIKEDGDYYFRPDDTLTRAQAAKILSVAAGTIASSSVSSALENDESDNLIVTKACTITNVDIPGNVIITEGVTSGTVNFVNCDIEGTVSNRSKAKVVFSNGSVETLDIDVASANVELKQSVKVEEVNVNYSNAAVAFSTNASVENFNVMSGSTGVSITGTSGEIETLTVKANSLTSTIVPEDCKIDSSVSATIGSVAYKDGIKGAVSILWTGDNEFISFETYKSGTMKYYYTASATAPSKTNFNTNYSNATSKASITATAEKKVIEKIDGTSTDLDEYPYVVAALVDGSTVVSTPVVISREGAKYGFTVMPSFGTSTTYDVLKGTAIAAGTLYYYYTNDETVPYSFAAAQTAYQGTESAVKGNFDCTTSAFSKNTKQISAVDAYAYCVVYYIDKSDTQYQPIILKRPEVTSSLTGEPYILISGKDGKDVLYITSSVSGQVKVLYTDSALSYTASTFTTAYNESVAAKDGLAYTSSKSISANTETKVELAVSKNVSKYDYALVQVGSGATPVKVTRYPDADGFTELPVVLKTPKEDSIVFTPIDDKGTNLTVKYFYTATKKNYTIEAFETAYAAAADNAKATITRLAANTIKKEASAKQSSNITENYVVFMFSGAYGNHLPVTVTRSDIGNGFVGTPTIEYLYDDGNAVMNFNVKAPHSIQYFTLSEADYKKFSQETIDYMFSTDKANILTISENEVKQGENKIVLSSEVTAKTEYIAIRAVDGTTAYSSLVVKVSMVDDGIIANVAGKPDITFESANGDVSITINPNVNAVGKTFKFYYTATEPKTTSDYNSIFSKSTVYGEYSIKTTGAQPFSAGKWSQMLTYKYLAFKVVDAKGDSMTYGYVNLDPLYLAGANIVRDGTSNSKLLISPVEAGTYKVYWFYSTEKLDIGTYSAFNTAYGKAATGYKNSKEVTAEKAHDSCPVVTDFVQPEASKPQYKYVYVMLQTKSGTTTINYCPVEKALAGVVS